MIDFTRFGCNAEDNRNWNDFLQAWPLERLRNMTLADYTQAGSAETFTAWIEQRLEKMGSMWGGSAFKFGIFSRANKEKKEDKEGARYTDAYAWTGKYGDTPEVAFTKVRSLVLAVAEAASRSDTAAIDGIDLGPVYKWKIAFHYQSFKTPTVLAVFKPEPLRQFLKSTATNLPLSQLYRDVLAKKPAGTPLMEFGGDIYAAWQENMPLWKLAHSTEFTFEEYERLLRDRLIVIYTGANEALSEQFRDKAKVGDLFYLCRDASVNLLGRITSDAKPFEEKGRGWYARNYEVLRYAASPDSFSGQDANWTPKGAAGFCSVGPQTLAIFQRALLRPIFSINLQMLEELRDAAQGQAAESALTQGALDNGYLTFPLAASIFPESSYGDRPGTTRGAPVRMVTEYGETYEDDIRVEGNTLRPRARFGAYFKKAGAMPGDRIRISGTPNKLYLMRLVPSGTAPIASLPQPEPTPMLNPRADTASLNVILYGPPGTGKTYLTAERAVQICDGAIPPQRHDLMKRYRQLCDAGRISFVTFHQSFSYEEFVEGIRPEVNGEGQISYDVRDGVFKQICDVAREKFDSKTAGASIDLSGRRLYKMSLGNTLDPADAGIFDRCIEKDIVLLGYGSDIDYTGCDTLAAVRERFRAKHPDPAEDTEYNVTAVHYLKNEIKNGDLVLVSDGNFKFRAVGEITGDYQVTNDPGGNQMRPVRWLKVLADSLPIETIFAKRLSQMTIYLMDQSAVKWEALKTLIAPTEDSGERQNYVLIIDEINRANISKTLGELITILEPDKRLDAANPIRVKLPYSGKDFGVPSNLFIVGTMNTADRSIALLDTALRRRFEFVEMRPRVDLLSEDVGGVNLQRLLEVLNQRVEFLFDREHVIGHAFFLDVVSLEQLRDVFRRKIIPLLQEYFYEDWEKVGAALNDDGANGGGFLVAEDLPVPKLLASQIEDSQSRRCHRVNPTAFPLAAFLRIYE